MKTSDLFEKVKNCTKKIIVLQGGGDAGKTVTVLQVLAAAKAAIENHVLITVTGLDVPNLKAGPLRAFQKYVASDPEIASHIKSYKETSRTFHFRNGSEIEFKSFDDEEDARGSERDYLFVNEANNLDYKLFWQLKRKTRKQVFLDYNPTQKFWVHNKLLDQTKPENVKEYGDKVQLYITDHRHNPFLTKEEHEDYENIADPEMFKVYARGMTGMVGGIIYRMKKVDKIPTIKTVGPDGKITEEPMPFGFGIDFGYNSDKSAIVKVYFHRCDRYYQQLLYKPENEILDEIISKNLQYKLGDRTVPMTPAMYMAKILKDNGCDTSTLVWGDHDKSMSAQLRKLNIPFRMARKGPNSLKTSISKVKSFNNYYYNSPNIEKELETYVWEKVIDILTGNEVTTNEPIDGMPDDLLAALRYFVYSHSMRFATD